MEEETSFWSSDEGYPWSEEDLQNRLASRLAYFDGLDWNQEFTTESCGESFDISAHETLGLDSSALSSPTPPADLDGFAFDFRQGVPTEYSGESCENSANQIMEPDLTLNSFTRVPGLHTPSEQWPDSYTPFNHFTTPNSSNMTCTPSSGCAVSSFGNSSISSEFPCLSPEPLAAVTSTPPFGGLLDMVLFDQNIQTDPVQYDAVISPSIMTNAQGLPPESSALKSALPQQRRRSGTPARERRKIEKPIQCQVCGKGWAYKSDRDRHILANHPERAHEFSVSTLRHTCLLCDTTFSRKDHKVRHDQRIHGAPKAIRGSRRKR
ncbi:hypothetical protein QBC42DRAFT_70198 [Cladorrhinum samala]|uniref:C2H2-type domain-containing protein n=1 Tax=Cladorrhinum samala TaxID=585594 RepID=A0AAV9HTU5_9PEZI|nr:hypothetical protein QBC42DRAFT_70198 [Cladorrhinum samala]